MTTSKKQKVVGSQLMINPDTNEAIPMQLVEVEDRDFNFHKFWLQNFACATTEISNAKMDLVFWIIDHLNNQNQLVMTQQKIADESGASIATVQRTIRCLLRSDPPFLQKINSGAYQINPDIIWKGSHSSRMGLVFQYATNDNNEQ